MIYRGLGFLPVVSCGSSPTPSPLPVIKLDRRHIGRLRKRDNLLTGDGGGGGGKAKSYDGKKAWSSINHSVHTLREIPDRYVTRLSEPVSEDAPIPPFKYSTHVLPFWCQITYVMNKFE
jgi:hypothetical protein